MPTSPSTPSAAAPNAGGAAAEAFARTARQRSSDLSHIFIAVARLRGVPARYVAGYFRRDDDATGPDAEPRLGGSLCARTRLDRLRSPHESA